MKSRPSQETNGEYFVDERGELWRQVTFCAEPTARLRNVKTGEHVSGACAAPIFERFTLLVRETRDA